MSDLLPFTLPWCLIHPSMPWYPHHSAFFHHYTLFIPFYPIICHSFALHSPLYPFTFFPPITTAKSLSFPPLQCLFTYTCCFMRRAIHLSAPWSIAFILTSPHINTLAVSCHQPLQTPFTPLESSIHSLFTTHNAPLKSHLVMITLRWSPSLYYI